MTKTPRDAPEPCPQHAAEAASEMPGPETPPATSHVLTIPEAAELLRIGRNSAYEAARRGEIPIVRIGGRLLVPRAALERMLERAGADHDGGEGPHGL